MGIVVGQLGAQLREQVDDRQGRRLADIPHPRLVADTEERGGRPSSGGAAMREIETGASPEAIVRVRGY